MKATMMIRESEDLGWEQEFCVIQISAKTSLA